MPLDKQFRVKTLSSMSNDQEQVEISNWTFTGWVLYGCFFLRSSRVLQLESKLWFRFRFRFPFLVRFQNRNRNGIRKSKSKIENQNRYWGAVIEVYVASKIHREAPRSISVLFSISISLLGAAWLCFALHLDSVSMGAVVLRVALSLRSQEVFRLPFSFGALWAGY